MIELTFERSLWWSIPCIVGAAVSAYFLYFYKRKFSVLQLYTLAVLRFLTVFFLLLLFLVPLLKLNQTEDQRPILVWLEDYSQSITASKDSADALAFLSRSDEFISQLEDKYEIEAFYFGEQIYTDSQNSFNFSQTDLSNVIKQVQERYYNRNVGAAVLLTDGIYNLGSDPAYLAQQSSFPLYTIGLGDPIPTLDVFIDRLVYNDYSHLNNRFPLQVHIKARKLKGQNVRLKILDSSDNIVETKSINVENDDYHQRLDFLIRSKETGIQRYTVMLDKLQEESNTINNRMTFSIEILDRQKRIWIIGKSPHPDMSALKRALESIKDYEVTTYTLSELNSLQGQADLMILHQPDDQILEKWYDSQKPGLLFFGPQSSGSNFSAITRVYYRQINEFEEVLPEINMAFNLFNLKPDELQFFNELSPLLSPFGEITSRINGQVLFNRKIGSISTNQPLWLFAEDDTRRWSVVNGINLWRWRITDFIKNNNHQYFDLLIQKTVQYLTSKKEKQRFVIETKTHFNLRETIRFSARLYNASLELTNRPEVKITITDEDNKRYSYRFSKATETYQLVVGTLPEGLYSWEGNVRLGRDSFVKRGEFSVERLTIEKSDLVARFEVLRKIAQESEGAFFEPEEINQLIENLRSNNLAKIVQYVKSEIKTIFSLKWLFFIFLTLLSVEWTLRKYWGNY